MACTTHNFFFYAGKVKSCFVSLSLSLGGVLCCLCVHQKKKEHYDSDDDDDSDENDDSDDSDDDERKKKRERSLSFSLFSSLCIIFFYIKLLCVV